MKKTIGDFLSRSHAKHTKSLMCFSVIVPLNKLLQFIAVGMNISIMYGQYIHRSNMLPEGSMIPLNRNVVNPGANSPQQSVRMAAIRKGNLRTQFWMNSILERTLCSAWTSDCTKRLQSSRASYWTSGRDFQKGKQTSTCSSLPGVSMT